MRCLTTRHWAEQLLEHGDPGPEPGVIMNLPTAPRPPTRRIVCGVDGSEQARPAASAHSISPTGLARSSRSST